MSKKAIGTYEIAKICHVTPATVGRWVDEGKLPCFTTGGGHRRVWMSDLIKYLKSHNMPIPPGIWAGSKTRILIVDDDNSIRKSVSRIIKKINNNIEIYEAGDGFEAGHKTGSLSPSLVILDLKLPGIDGIEVCKLIRKDKKLSETKILAISGYNSKEIQTQILKSGANDFSAKPIDPQAFTDKVLKLLPILKN